MKISMTASYPKRPAYLFVLPWSLVHLGGVNQVVINLAQEMLKSGTFEPIFLIADWDSPRPIWGNFNGLKTVHWRIRFYQNNMNLKEWISFRLWELHFGPEFDRFCRKHQVIAVNIHYPGATAFSIDRIMKKYQPLIPLIVSFHGTDLNQIRNESVSTIALWRKLLLKTNGNVVCSNDLGKKIVEAFGDDVIPCVIPNGIDAASFIAMAEKSIRKEERIILNVAKFEEKKGQDVLVQAFATIAHDYGDVNLVFVGATDSALPALRNLCIQKGIEERVRFYADVPHHQVANFFLQASFFALPSRQESFGLVLLEAGALGLPVVASRVGGIPEILIDGVTGRLVAPDNPAELALCLRSLLDCQAAALEMGERLRRHVLSEFTCTSAYEKYVALISNEQKYNFIMDHMCHLR